MKFIFQKYEFPKLLRNHSCLILPRFNSNSWNIVFFGSDKFSLVSLKKLYSNKKLFNNIEVVTAEDSNPVYNFAISNKIKVYKWPPVFNESHDFGVVVSFGKLIPKTMIEHFSLGIINVHPSLLPQWRGAMPIVYSLKNGDTVTGITVIKINEKFDMGNIILKKSCSIGENELLPSLYNRLSKFGADCLLEVIHSMPECLKEAVAQSNENVTYAPLLSKKASFINWNVMTASEIYNLYRALFSLLELETSWMGNKVKLVCISLHDFEDCLSSDLKEVTPGSVHYSNKNKCLIVQCKVKSVRICTLRFNGKLYSAYNFYLGFLSRVPKVCWMLGD